MLHPEKYRPWFIMSSSGIPEQKDHLNRPERATEDNSATYLPNLPSGGLRQSSQGPLNSEASSGVKQISDYKNGV